MITQAIRQAKEALEIARNKISVDRESCPPTDLKAWDYFDSALSALATVSSEAQPQEPIMCKDMPVETVNLDAACYYLKSETHFDGDEILKAWNALVQFYIAHSAMPVAARPQDKNQALHAAPAVADLTEDQNKAISENYSNRWQKPGAWDVRRCVDNAVRDVVSLIKRQIVAAAPSAPAVAHDSDCSTHNEPAYPTAPCDCSVKTSDAKE
jgi:hypothetical protein